MKAFRLRAAGLVMEEMGRPVAGAGEIVVRVMAAGVTPTELVWWPTTHTKEGKERDGAVVGHEFSGVVEEVGSGVSGVRMGEAVYGMNDWFGEGATAEFCVTRAEWVAGMPRGMGFVEAASVPIGALTAWQGLFERAKLQRGERVLVQGGSGAVGVYVVQLAKRAGARVVATAAARNEVFLRELGAERVIDYRTGDFTAERAEVVFDCVGGETLRKSWDVLAPDGRMVTIAADVEGSRDEREKGAFFIVETKREQLVEIGRLLESGELKTVVDAVVPLAEAGAAYRGEVAGRRGRGKVVVEIGAG